MIPSREAVLVRLVNLLTLIRILAVPLIIWLVLRSEDGSSTTATAVFAFAAFTDFLDGQLARNTGSVTEIGKILDPLADRIFISGCVVALAIAQLLPLYGVILIVIRDFLVILGYKTFKRQGIIIRVSPLGKTYTALLMVAIVLSMAGIKPSGIEIGRWLFWLGVAGSLLSGVAYLLRGISLFNRAKATV